MYVFGNKTANIYTMSPDEHATLLKDNVTKKYQKALINHKHAINHEAKNMAKSYEIDKRECMAHTPAFIALKTFSRNYL